MHLPWHPPPHHMSSHISAEQCCRAQTTSRTGHDSHSLSGNESPPFSIVWCPFYPLLPHELLALITSLRWSGPWSSSPRSWPLWPCLLGCFFVWASLMITLLIHPSRHLVLSKGFLLETCACKRLSSLFYILTQVCCLYWHHILWVYSQFLVQLLIYSTSRTISIPYTYLIIMMENYFWNMSTRVLSEPILLLLSFLFHPFFVQKKTTENIGLIRDLKEHLLHDIYRYHPYLFFVKFVRNMKFVSPTLDPSPYLFLFIIFSTIHRLPSFPLY